ncbi:response regulator transcription factor [Umezawaea sp. Da 62-37]|uniref:response regulator transcription factor n=1 Tax=Umezawaea sp. Da 62-37 TaxID=3075927 RepID=UPI0028F6D2F8|nr:response regulator transcription factor [Umezawaea sp. Da 62-37]WNV92003.1 response regulator transcription factor [Umezawaea sp. Da 62-37]
MRVLVVDDHAVVRSGVRAEMGTDVDVVGEAEDVGTALAAIGALAPDVVLLDVHLPGGGGRAVLAAAVPAFPAVRFLALSVSDASQDVIAVIRAGARGYATKAITGSELRAAIRRVHAGDAYFSPHLAGFVLDAFRGDPDLDGLTPRERDVLRLVAAGYTYREVGERLSISGRTVETHAAAVLRKLQLPNRRELSRWARARKLL